MLCVYSVRCLELLRSVRNGQGPGKHTEQQLGVERGWLRACMHHAVAPTIPSLEQAPSIISTPHSWFFL